MDAQRLNDLYRAVVMEHHRRPRGQGAPSTFASKAYGKNPVCGDEVAIYLTPYPQGGWETRWTGEGCAVCRASASILAEATLGLVSPGELAGEVLRHLRQATPETEASPTLPESVKALGGSLAAAPARRGCAVLPWSVFAEAWGQLAAKP